MKEVLGKTDFDFFPEDIAKKIKKNDNEVIDKKQSTGLEELAINYSGRKIKMLSFKCPETDDGGKVTGVLGISIEITDYINSKIEALHTLSEILDSIPEHVYWKDTNGVFVGCNRQQAKSVGLSSAEDLIGKTDYDILPVEQAESIVKTDKEIIDSGKSKIIFEKSNEHNGLLASYKSHKAPLRDSEGNIIGILGVSLDITELERNEKKLKLALNKSLVAEKTKNAILHNFRHDLLTSQSGHELLRYCIETMREGDTIEAEDLEDVFDSYENIYDHMTQIHSLIEAVEGHPPQVKKIIDCYEIAEKVFIMHKAAAKVKKINFTYEADREDWSQNQLGDDERITRILITLVGNAIKFTKEGGSVDIILKRKPQKDNKVAITFLVKDTGIGISKEHIQSIYDSFFKLKPSYETSDLSESGPGVGLSIAKIFTNDINGQLDCNSIVGDGSVFSLGILLENSLVSLEELKP